MADGNQDVALVRQGYEAFTTGDAAWMNDHLADDVVWHVGGKNKLSGAHRGKEAVLTLFTQQAQVFGGVPQLDVHDVVGNDEHVIAIGTASANDPDGGTVEWRWANVFHIEDGKAKEVWGLAEETSAVMRSSTRPWARKRADRPPPRASPGPASRSRGRR
ncbi:MAG: nuclear transport factor 2 family protein [Actinomycetota bacterium]